MKHVLKTLMGITAPLLLLLLIPGTMVAQKGKPSAATELYARFRDAAGDKIYGGTAGAFYTVDDRDYPNIVKLAENGALWMWTQQPGQQVSFAFDTPLRNWLVDGKAMCRAYSSDGTGDIFYSTPPAFLLGDGRPNNDLTLITTGGGYTETNGIWSYSSTYVNLRAVTGVAYVSMSIRFDIPDESLFMFFGSNIWTLDYAKPVNGWTGIVQVTRTSGTSWDIEPLPIDHPIAEARGLQTAQTALFMQGSTGKGAKGLSGNCDLGDWQMPFVLSLWVR